MHCWGVTSVALLIAAAVNDWQQQTEWWQCQLQRAAGLVRQQSGNCVECNAVCARLCCAVAWVTCVVWGVTSVALWNAAAVNDWQQQTEWWHCQLQRAAGFVRQQSGNCVECNVVCARLCCTVAWVTCVVWGNVLSGAFDCSCRQ